MSSNVNSILIIGLGMIGSSIALASKSKGITVHGFDIDNVVFNDAIKKDIIAIDAGTIEEINSKESVKNITVRYIFTSIDTFSLFFINLFQLLKRL